MKSRNATDSKRKPMHSNSGAGLDRPALILASASPRRAQLLKDAGYTFLVRPSPLEEPRRRPRSIPIAMWPAALAYIKARSVADQIAYSNTIVLGADTVVVLGNKILNKPRDRKHAAQMLRGLSGRRHVVLTGIALLHGPHIISATAAAICRVKKLTTAELNAYLDSNLWQGKAGAYGIQDDHDPFVTLISGEWSTVVGLPMRLLQRQLGALISTSKRSKRRS
jgi:septum formation protein